ncbi:universal stress protein [Streptomyces nymphaeiformis]|uniref:Nucleotide-binding universal stress UspA family protein n=1 Tax=Streptomyces nymphaeiformis TaxID=2663842 RepID=A0A7W7U433_9ACTN|nr:universal stress protein [Streptomyces nymphaeiformis]MBB4984266.1 nucleotide-binding universal stress UspA family protein [Streptomyces nymphaeiformis]
MNEILLGIDPREQSIPALVWAAAEAVRRGLTLRLVVAVPPAHNGLRYDALAHQSALRLRAESAIANAEDLVRELHAGLRIATERVNGVPATVLRDLAAHAALVVVGSRRLGRAAEVFSESSVVVPLTARAACPVVVVRVPEHTAVHPPTLVVGVDGSPSSQAAVAFAAAEASLREARLRAVWVWPPSLLAHDDADEGLAERRRLLAESVAGWAEKYPDVAVFQEVLRGHPVEQLALASQESLALIVGRRGRGGYSGMRLGSTVHGLLHRVMCPVITVPFPQRGERPGDPAWADRSRFRTTDRPRPVDPLGTGPLRLPRGTVGREDDLGPSAGSPER